MKKIITALLLTFLWMLGLFVVGAFFGMIPLPFPISFVVFFLLAGGASVYFTCKPIGLNKKNLPLCILAFFSVALMPLTRLALQTKVRTWFVCLLLICGIPLWLFETTNPARMAIGGAECIQIAHNAARDMSSFMVALSVYQNDYNNMVPSSFRELYQDEATTYMLYRMPLTEVEKKYRYLPPAQEPPAKETLLIYERKPAWHFHTLREGDFRVCAVSIDKKEKPVSMIIKTPKERYNGRLRKVFFWYFIGTPFKGPEELTPEEIQGYYEKQKVEWKYLKNKYGRSK